MANNKESKRLAARNLIEKGKKQGSLTLDEITEIMTKVALKQINAPCIVYNLNGYYDSLKVLLDHMIEMGLSTSDKQKKIYFLNNLLEIGEILTNINE